MEKRTILAVALSMFVLTVWYWAFPREQQKRPPFQLSQSFVESAVTQENKSTDTNIFVVQKDENEVLYSVDFNKVRLFLSQSNSNIKEILMSSFDFKIPLKNILLFSADSPINFEAVPNKPRSFLYEGDDLRILRTVEVSDSEYQLSVKFDITNKSNKTIKQDFKTSLGSVDPSSSQTENRFFELSVFDESGILRQPPFKKPAQEFRSCKAIGFRDQYFCAILKPSFDGCIPFLSVSSKPKESTFGLTLPTIDIQPGETVRKEFILYAGPQDATYLNKIGYEYSQIRNFGKLDSIAKIILSILNFSYGITKNWGLAILVLSFILFAVLSPLSLKQVTSMKRMQKIQPKMLALREQHKNNPKKMNEEIMELYKKEKVNPFGGCLPLLLQMPIFIALYQALMRSIELKNAHFLWIKDLSSPDKLFSISGFSVNILPIAMAGLMFFQQKLTSPDYSNATDPASEQQKMMMYIFPVFFTFVFYNFPAGLVLYWSSNTLFNVLLQTKISRKSVSE